MAETHTAPPSRTALAIHTVPLSGESKALNFVEANAHVTHVVAQRSNRPLSW